MLWMTTTRSTMGSARILGWWRWIQDDGSDLCAAAWRHSTGFPEVAPSPPYTLLLQPCSLVVLLHYFTFTNAIFLQHETERCVPWAPHMQSRLTRTDRFPHKHGIREREVM